MHTVLVGGRQEEGKGGEKGKRKGRAEGELTLSFWWRKMLACWFALLMMHNGVWRGGGS
jgi:hypothetical protein